MEKMVKGRATSVRFSDIEWFHPNIPVIIGGIGGLGSWLTFFLARQECQIYVHDMDNVDETNLGGQLYGTQYIGKRKEDAIMDIVKTFCNHTNIFPMGKFTSESFASPIMFSAFDNMVARKLMFSKWKAQKDREIFIDARMLIEKAQIFAVLKGSEERYEESLFDDSEVIPQACSAKATSHCGAIAAGYMVAVFNNYVSRVKDPNCFREIPFLMTVELPTLTQFVEL